MSPVAAAQRHPPSDRTSGDGRPDQCLRSRAVRLIVARCSIDYSGRLKTHLPEALRLLMIKGDGTFTVWSDGGDQKVKPQNNSL